MYINKRLDQYLRKLSEDCADLIDARLNDRSYAIRVNTPVRKNDKLVSIREEHSTDYHKFLHDVKNNELWKSYSHFTISKNILKSKYKLRSNSHDDELDHFAHTQIALFVTQLAKHGGHKSPIALRHTLSKFWKHLNKDLHNTTYIAPLYNIMGDFSTIQLTNNICVRPVTEEEYSKIVRLQSVPLREIDTYRKRLKFVLSCSMPGSPSADLVQQATSEYSFVVNLLKLFTDGYPQFGRVYEVESEHLDVGMIEPQGSYYENPTAFKETTINKNNARRFEAFYCMAIKRLDAVKNPEFMRNAIARFGMAYVHRTPSNKIVDYVISLEALLVPDPGESTQKLAHRTAALYADTDLQRAETWEFIKQAYSFRSGIVHKSQERPIKIRSSTLGVEDVEAILHKIAKESILRMLGLMGSYKNQKDILSVLDRSIYDRNEMREVRKAWQSIKPYCR